MKKITSFRNPVLENLFNKVASSYGSIGPQYFNYFGKVLVDNADLKEGDFVLDAATGRGASLFPAAKKVGSSGKIIGIDLSSEMIKETQKEIIKLSLKNAEVQQMTAEQLEFEDNYFDCVLCGLAIHFFIDCKGALKEFFRVLKSDGSISISMWEKKDDKDWAIGRVLSRVIPNYLPPAPINPSIKPSSSRPELGDEKVLKSFLEDAGFKNIKILKEEKNFFFKDFEEWWQEQWTHAGRAPFEVINIMGSNYLNKFKKDLSEEFHKEFGSGSIPLEGVALLAYGNK